MEAKEKEQGLEINLSVLPHVNEEDGSVMAVVWFSGDTKPNKDEIKALGYYC